MPSPVSPPPETLEIPSTNPATSRFVLPPPRSDLLDRLHAFLPQIKSANERLADEPQVEGEREEAVILEEFSSSEDDSDEEEDGSSSEEDSSDDDDEDSEANGEAGADGRTAKGVKVDALAHLMDISAPPRVAGKTRAGGEVTDSALGEGEAKGPVGIVEMEA